MNFISIPPVVLEEHKKTLLRITEFIKYMVSRPTTHIFTYSMTCILCSYTKMNYITNVAMEEHMGPMTRKMEVMERKSMTLKAAMALNMPRPAVGPVQQRA